MDYTKTKEYQDFLKTKREESKKNKGLFPYVDVHAKVLRNLRLLLNNGCCETLYEFQLAYEEVTSRLIAKKVNEVR